MRAGTWPPIQTGYRHPPAFSLFAFGEAKELLEKDRAVPAAIDPDVMPDNEQQLFGSDADRPFRNRLNISGLSLEQLADWVEKKC